METLAVAVWRLADVKDRAVGTAEAVGTLEEIVGASPLANALDIVGNWWRAARCGAPYERI